MSKVNATELATIFNEKGQYKTYKKAIDKIRLNNSYYYIDNKVFFGNNTVSPIHFLEFLGYTPDFLKLKTVHAVKKML